MIATWLATLAPSLVKRTLAALGLGVVVITGLASVGDALNGYISSAFAGLPADLLAIMNLAGIGLGLNIILGAIAARMALYVLMASSRVIGI
jgi:hypothetical protein